MALKSWKKGFLPAFGPSKKSVNYDQGTKNWMANNMAIVLHCFVCKENEVKPVRAGQNYINLVQK